MTETLTKKELISSKISNGISSGKYPPGYRFPSEPALAKELGVSRITLRGAFRNLEKKGLIIRLHGKGTFVQSAQDIKKKQKKYLIAIYNTQDLNENPEFYAVPHFERLCERNNILTERISIDIIRAMPEKHAVEMLKKENYSAVLLCGFYYLGHEKEIPIMKALNIPVLIPHCNPLDGHVTGFAAMFNDYKQANIDALRFLKSKGHRNIITIGKASKSNLFLHGFELQEYIDFLAEEGLNPDPSLILLLDLDQETITNSLREIFRRPGERPGAVMCFSDFYALKVYEGLKQLSLTVPDDISVMGTCAYPGGHMLKPALSTVDFEYDRIGEMAFEVLESQAEWFNRKGVKTPEIISPHKITARESVRQI